MSGTLGVLVPEFPTQTHAFFWREICALEAAGIKVEVISTSRPPADACKHAFVGEARGRTHYLYPPRMGVVLAEALRRCWRLPRVVGYAMGLKESTLKEKLRVAGAAACSLDLCAHSRAKGIGHIHVHSCADAAHVVAMARLLGGPTYSLHLHGDLPVYGKDHASKMKHTTFVSADARPMQMQAVEKVGMPQDRTYTIWMGVHTAKALPPEGGRPEREALQLVTVARLNPAKGYDHALGALRLAIDRGARIRYTIAGSGPYEAKVRERIKQLKLDDHVTMAGTVGEEDVVKLLRSSDVFILASTGLGEASPVAVMEAMSTGLAVVVSHIGGTPDMITDGVDGFLTERGNESQIADRLCQLASSKELRDRLGGAARKRAETQFDVSWTANKIVEAVERHSEWRRGHAAGNGKAST